MYGSLQCDFLDPETSALDEYIDSMIGKGDRRCPADGCGHRGYHRRSLGLGPNIIFMFSLGITTLDGVPVGASSVGNL